MNKSTNKLTTFMFFFEQAHNIHVKNIKQQIPINMTIDYVMLFSENVHSPF